jgi:exosome complex component RRP40
MDSYIVDVKGTSDAILGAYDFEGATKRNKPELQVGTLIYARVEDISIFLKTKLMCTDP